MKLLIKMWLLVFFFNGFGYNLNLKSELGVVFPVISISVENILICLDIKMLFIVIISSLHPPSSDNITRKIDLMFFFLVRLPFLLLFFWPVSINRMTKPKVTVCICEMRWDVVKRCHISPRYLSRKKKWQ